MNQIHRQVVFKGMKKKWRQLSESANYRDNKFMNFSPTPMMAEGVSYTKVFREFLKRPKSVTPSKPVPSVKTNLKELHSEEPLIVWFGHSSYLIHSRGKNILADPVFSGHASPVPAMIKAFPGADVYKAADFPTIDLLILTHNHYDHFDRKTIRQLQPKIRSAYVPLGVGKDLSHCGIAEDLITEMDWWETVEPAAGLSLSATPARHFSGRGLVRGGSLWVSYVLKIHGYSIYLGGDSGYDTHFKQIGEKFGPMDLAILECGQYNDAWPFIHMKPEETVQAAMDLQAKVLLPVHWGKFSLAYHAWDEPIRRAVAYAKQVGMKTTTPMIGEPVKLGKKYPDEQWWKF
jgi:L-ascorbate metabolism protein UlaG (beta-lactamase superfamily)